MESFSIFLAYLQLSICISNSNDSSSSWKSTPNIFPNLIRFCLTHADVSFSFRIVRLWSYWIGSISSTIHSSICVSFYKETMVLWSFEIFIAKSALSLLTSFVVASRMHSRWFPVSPSHMISYDDFISHGQTGPKWIIATFFILQNKWIFQNSRKLLGFFSIFTLLFNEVLNYFTFSRRIVYNLIQRLQK